jgi:HlyD family secretion protein
MNLPSRRVYIFIGLVILIAVIAVFGQSQIFGPKVAVQSLQAQQFNQTLVASGRVENPHRIDLGVQMTGRVQKVNVTEGQQVSSGMVLFELEASELQAALKQAQLAEKQALLAVRQIGELREPIAEQIFLQARVNRDNAKRSYERTVELTRKGFMGVAAKDESERTLFIAQSQLTTAQQQLASVRKGGTDSAAAETALAAARAAVDGAVSRLRYTKITAPVAGTLISRNVEQGDIVLPGKVLMMLSPQGATQLVVQIDEKNLHLLKLDQAAQASADAFAGQRFAAHLIFINPGIDPQRGSVEIKFLVPEPPAYLRQDMTVSVDIEIAHRDQALLLAATSIHDLHRPKPWVILAEDGKAKYQTIQTGIISHGMVEILDGLKAGDQFLTDATAVIKEGARIRVFIDKPSP